MSTAIQYAEGLHDRRTSLRNEEGMRHASQIDFNANQGWLERKIKPKKITARYPFKGKALLYMTCAFGSLGDALFGYNSGKSYDALSRTILQADLL